MRPETPPELRTADKAGATSLDSNLIAEPRPLAAELGAAKQNPGHQAIEGLIQALDAFLRGAEIVIRLAARGIVDGGRLQEWS